MVRLEKLRKAKMLLEMVLKDRANLPEALRDWPEEGDADAKLLDTARWQLVYIQNDEDIIGREPDYREKMLRTLTAICGDVAERIQAVESTGMAS